MERRTMSMLLIWGILFWVNSATWGLTVLDPAYKVEFYTSYISASLQRNMTFDPYGNLYICHRDDNKIMKVDTSGDASILATGINTPQDIVWAGDANFGDNFYVASSSTGNIYQLDANGNWNLFSDTGQGHAYDISFDRHGYYNGNLYVTTTNDHHIISVDSNGQPQVFDSWLQTITNNIVNGVDFDPSDRYSNAMYVGTSYEPAYASQSGLFQVDTLGNGTKFTEELVSVNMLMFDPCGDMFDYDLFVSAKENYGDVWAIWRVDELGHASKFIEAEFYSLAFYSDGAMYVSEYDWGTDIVTISRVSLIPEPATLTLMAIGGLALFKRRRLRLK